MKIFYDTFNSVTVVSVGGAVALGESDVAGSEVTYSVISVLAELRLTLVEETSAG